MTTPIPAVPRSAGRPISVIAAVTAGVAAVSLGGFVLGTDGDTLPRAVVGLTVGALAVAVVVVRTVSRTIESVGSQPLTVATWVTLARGWLLVPFAGFLFIDSGGGTGAWIPGGLFAAAALLDAVDGTIARRTDSVSELGGRLDVEIDSAIVLLGSVAVVLAGSAPVPFLAVGVARYAFVAGIGWRRARGLPVVELDSSQRRRLAGALVMATIWLAVLPVPGPGASRAIATIGAVPVLAGFLRDWLFVSGRIAA